MDPTCHRHGLHGPSPCGDWFGELVLTRLMWPPHGLHVRPEGEVALEWRRRGLATPARHRRRCGDEPAGVIRHSEVRGCAQKREGEILNVMLTGIARMRGGKVVGDEVERRRSSVDGEVGAPGILRRCGCAHQVRSDAVMLMVVEARTRCQRNAGIGEEAELGRRRRSLKLRR